MLDLGIYLKEHQYKITFSSFSFVVWIYLNLFSCNQLILCILHERHLFRMCVNMHYNSLIDNSALFEF